MPANSMKANLILVALCLLAPALLNADELHTPLSKEMESLSKNLRQLGRQVTDSSKRDSSLQLVLAVEKSAATARTLVPAKAKEVPASDQAKFISDYQKQIDVLIGQLTKLEEATRAGNTDSANQILSSLRGIKREGHEKFSSE